MDNIQYSRRLKQACKKLKMSQIALGQLIGRHGNTIKKWQNGTSLPDEHEEELIESKAGIRIEYLRTGEEPMFTNRAKIIHLKGQVLDVINKFNHHPGINVWAETGAGDRYIPDPNQDQPMEIIQIDNFLNPKYRDCFRVRGNSMHPVIHPGALVFVNFNDKKPVSNQMYVLNIPSEGLVVKVLIVQTHQVIIHSYNPAVPDDIIQHEDLANNMIAGRVVLIHQEVL